MCAMLAQQPAEPETPWAMVFPQERKRREPGVGKRSDMIYWGHWAEDGSVQPSREPSTAAWALGYQLTGEWTMARRALGAAAAKFAMAPAGVARRARARRYGRGDLLGGRGTRAQLGLRDGDGLLWAVVDGHARNTGCGGAAGRVGRRPSARADPNACATAGWWAGHSAVLQWGRGAAGAGVARVGGGRLAMR